MDMPSSGSELSLKCRADVGIALVTHLSVYVTEAAPVH